MSSFARFFMLVSITSLLSHCSTRPLSVQADTAGVGVGAITAPTPAPIADVAATPTPTPEPIPQTQTNEVSVAPPAGSPPVNPLAGIVLAAPLHVDVNYSGVAKAPSEPLSITIRDANYKSLAVTYAGANSNFVNCTISFQSATCTFAAISPPEGFSVKLLATAANGAATLVTLSGITVIGVAQAPALSSGPSGLFPETTGYVGAYGNNQLAAGYGCVTGATRAMDTVVSNDSFVDSDGGARPKGYSLSCPKDQIAVGVLGNRASVQCLPLRPLLKLVNRTQTVYPWVEHSGAHCPHGQVMYGQIPNDGATAFTLLCATVTLK